MKREYAILIGVALIATAIIASMAVKFPVGVFWKTKASSPQGDFNMVINGVTELIGANNQPIKLEIYMKSILPLAFYHEGIEVEAMKVTITYQADGQDIDWSTLKIYVDAEGTGGYKKSEVLTTKTGTVTFILPFSTSLLGRTPSSGEEITWKMTITVKGQVKDLTGKVLTAKAKPLTASAKTVWREPSFSVTASSSTSITTSDGTTVYSGSQDHYLYTDEYMQTDIYGGGCGIPGQHLVWTCNVQPQTENPWFWINSTLIVAVIFYGLIISGAILIGLGLKGKKK